MLLPPASGVESKDGLSSPPCWGRFLIPIASESMMRRIKQGWTEEDLARLKQFVAAGASPMRASAALERSTTTVKSKARRLGSPFCSMYVEGRKRRAKCEAAAATGLYESRWDRASATRRTDDWLKTSEIENVD